MGILLNEENLSSWAYIYCTENDNPELEIKELITNSFLAYEYCIRKEKCHIVEKNITDSYMAYLYCSNYNNVSHVRQNIIEPIWAYVYCRDIDDDPEVRKNITYSMWAFEYCVVVKNDPEVRKYVNSYIERIFIPIFRFMKKLGFYRKIDNKVNVEK